MWNVTLWLILAMFSVLSMHMYILNSFYRLVCIRTRQVGQKAKKSVCQKAIAIKELEIDDHGKEQDSWCSFSFVLVCFPISPFSISFFTSLIFFLDSFPVFIPWSSAFFSSLVWAWLTLKLDSGRGNYLGKCQRVTAKRHKFAHFPGNMFNSTWTESKILRYRKVIKEILLLSTLQSLNYHWHK